MDGTTPLVSVLSFLFGRESGRPPPEWEQLQSEVHERLGHMEYMKIVMPLEFYATVETGEKLHAEAVGSYLLGFTNASIPMSFRCLEVGMSKKYKFEEGSTPSNLDAYDLLEYFDEELGEGVISLQWFRKLRNKIHTDELVEEADALEAIRHTTNGLTKLFPRDRGTAFGRKACCGNEYEASFDTDEIYLGNVLDIVCEGCRQVTPHRVLPHSINQQI